MSKDEEITDGKASPDDIVATLAENTPHLPTSISKRSFMDDAYLEDGPLFRATIKQLEDRTSQLKQSLKRIIKSASAALDIRRQLSRADETYYEALREMQCAEPLMSHYLNHAYHIIQQERTRLDQSLYSQMLTPLRQIYEQDIKMAELKRRQFEEESKDYYASLAKYLKSKKKSTEEEQKKQQQRKNRFDLARFDYLGFLLDVHGGRKENDILFCITDHTMRDLHYYESIAAKIEPEKPGLDQLVSLMTANALEQELATNERAAKRKELLCNIDNVDQQLKQAEESSDESAVVAAAAAPAIPELNFSHQQQQHSSNEDVMFKGIRDMEQQRDQVVVVGRKKEGFLFATAKPSKSTGGFDVTSSSVTWHKYWCVLSGGQLHEYSNWKRQLEPHIDPINLRFATVREARNAERRFCFEVITPHMRRIYQATSEEEAQSWIGTIHNSIESVLNGTSASSANLFDRGAAAAAAAAAVSPTATTSTTKRHARSLSGAFKNGFAAVAAATSSTAANQGAGVMTSPSQSSSSSTTTTPKDRTSKRQSALHHSHTNTTAADGNTPSEGAELLVSASSSPNDRFRWSGFSFGSHHDKHNGTNKLSSIQQSSNNNGNYVFSSLPDSEANTRLLSILREDASNHYCVDCGAKNPDWCSLNLGVLLCIECSGIHRSLGTHISKIRSLTLDSTSYTPDIVELLKSIGNARSNAIWDARFEKTPSTTATATTATTTTTTLIPRPNPTDSRAIKLAYIQAKYVGRQFVKKPSKHDSQLTADELLFEAIDQDDIPKALLALASGANVNSSRPDSIKSPRISLLLPSPDQQQQQQHQHAAQKFLPFLMDLDDESSKKLQVQEDNDDTQEVDGHYIVRYALHYALLHGREATSDELFYPSPIVLQSSSSIKTNTTETGGDASSILSTSSENAQATSISPRKIIFPMAEFLLQNGADTGIVDPETGLTLADLVGMGSIVNDNAIAYISIKNTARGQSAITRSSTILNQHLLSLQQQSIKEEAAAAAAAAAASSKNKSTEDLSRIEEASVDDIPPPLPPRKDNPAPPHVDQ